MLITRESEYAMRMVRALADNEVRAVRKICDDELIPHKWAYKILKKMERAKIVKAFHGANGGYRLDMELSQISMLDILGINENTLRFNECMYSANGCMHHGKTGGCEIRRELGRLETIIKTALSERTMDMVVEAIEPSGARSVCRTSQPSAD